MTEPGERWRVVATDIPTLCKPHPDKPGWEIHTPGEPGAYAVVDPDWGNEQARFPTQREAQAEADRLNVEDVERTLDPVSVVRRRRLRELGETFWVRYGDGPIARRWPPNPGRFAVLEWSDRYSESFWQTYEMEGVEEEIATGDVERVVDLDTGDEMPFSVSVEWGNP
jgi:hypothetical protein